MEGRQFNRRTLAVAAVLAAVLAVFAGVLYNLQVVHGADYRAMSVVKITNRETVEGARGELLDRYGRELVTNRAVYEITLNTGLMGDESERNPNLMALIDICRDNGQSWTDSFPVSAAAPFTYTTDTPLAYEKEGGGVAFTLLGQLLNVLPMKDAVKAPLNLPSTRDMEAAKTLADIPAGPTAEELMDALRTYFEIDPAWSDEDARALIGVLYEVNLRSYDINRQEYVFAQGVDIDVISAVKERGLTGVSVETTTVRQYNTASAAHILGHVGSIYTENWETYRKLGYNMNDKVGIDGAENAFESYLHGESGTLVQELDTSGKVVGEYWYTDPETGVEDKSKLVLQISFAAVGFEVDENGLLADTAIYRPAPDTVAKRLAQADTVVTYDESDRNPSALYTTEEGMTVRLWYEDARSVADKLTLARMMGITGVSVWRLGNVPAYSDIPDYDAWAAILAQR